MGLTFLFLCFFLLLFQFLSVFGKINSYSLLSGKQVKLVRDKTSPSYNKKHIRLPFYFLSNHHNVTSHYHSSPNQFFFLILAISSSQGHIQSLASIVFYILSWQLACYVIQTLYKVQWSRIWVIKQEIDFPSRFLFIFNSDVK